MFRALHTNTAPCPLHCGTSFWPRWCSLQCSNNIKNEFSERDWQSHISSISLSINFHLKYHSAAWWLRPAPVKSCQGGAIIAIMQFTPQIIIRIQQNQINFYLFLVKIDNFNINNCKKSHQYEVNYNTLCKTFTSDYWRWLTVSSQHAEHGSWGVRTLASAQWEKRGGIRTKSLNDP